VTRLTLTPVVLTPNNAANLAAANFTALAAAGHAPSGTGTGNGVQFPFSPGQTFLLVSVGSTATTPTIAAGLISAAVTLNALAVSALAVLPSFYSAMLMANGMVGVDFSSVTGVLCTAIQLAGVY
jgi:hypothetical protein